MLIEVSGNDREEVSASLMALAEELDEKELVNDMFIADNVTQFKNIWDIRDSMGEVLAKYGITISLDVSLNVSDFQNLVKLTREKFGDKVKAVTGFGHVGDGNLHLTAVLDTKEAAESLEHEIDELVIPYVIERNGSISAEHGVGQMKADYLGMQKGDEVMEQLREVKQLFDENNI